MLRSLYSGVSGMRSNQIKMDVIGNNISNSTTTGFKAGRARFQDLFSQTLSNAQGPSSGGTGGVNPKQVGLGVSLTAIDTIMTGGALQPTGRDLDFAVEGEGFFIVSPDSTGDTKSYTRDGAFFTDQDGNLVNANGMRVLGYLPTDTISSISATTDPTHITTPDFDDLEALTIPGEIDGKKIETFSIDGTGLIKGVYGGTTYYLGRVGIAKFSNPEGLEKLGSNLYADTTNSGPVEVGEANKDGFGAIKQGVVEMSNVDLANEFTEMIITSRAYSANSRTITTSDEMLQELLNLKR